MNHCFPISHMSFSLAELLTSIGYALHQIWEVFSYYYFQYFLYAVLSPLFLGHWLHEHRFFDIVPQALEVLFIFLFNTFFYYSDWIISTNIPSSSESFLCYFHSVIEPIEFLFWSLYFLVLNFSFICYIF